MTEQQRCKLLAFMFGVPDPKEAFELLDLMRELNAINADEAASIMREYWEVD